MLRSWTTCSALCLCLAIPLAAPLSAVRAQDPIPNGFAARVKPFVDKHELAGAVMLAASKDEVLRVEAVGWADIANQAPMKEDSLFWIASQTKPMTGASLMILVDEGKVSLDDPVSKYIPEFASAVVAADPNTPNAAPVPLARPITLREVMSHTSGLPFKSAAEQPTLDALPLAEAVASYAKTPFIAQPGTKYQYSNAGINTGARVIEIVSGVSYEDFMQKRIFDPLGMKDTTFRPTEAQVARLAKGYKPNAVKSELEETKVGQLSYPLTSRANRFPMPAGGLFSTAADCAAFCRMVLRGGELDGKRILSEAAVKTMTSKQTPEGLKDGYGIGWATQGPDKSFGHGGAWATNMNVDVPRGLVTVWLVQHQGFVRDGGKAQGVFKSAAEELVGVK